MDPSQLKEKITLFPTTAGVYQMLNHQGKIIYIGKAKNLRSRVRSYFNAHQTRTITKILVSKIYSIDYILTRTEQEALILENDLIKKHQPFFNIDLKDNKSYPYLCLTNTAFPSLIKTRNLSNKGSYIGPFTNVTLLNTYLEIVHHLYPLKKCQVKHFPSGFKPCLYFHIGQCLDYCTGQVKQATIDQINQEIKELIQGKNKEVIGRLKEKMKKESAAQNYEKAKNIKYYIEVLSQFETKQTAFLTNQNNFDVIHYSIQDRLLVTVVLQFRGGRLIHKKNFDFKSELFEKDLSHEIIADSLEQFIFDYYSKEGLGSIKELIVPPFFSQEKDFKDRLQSIMKSISDRERKFPDETQSTGVSCPKVTTALKGEKNSYLKLAEANAKFSIQEAIHQKKKSQFAQHLKILLKLTKTPRVIESFDIANTADKHIMAGMVRFVDGEGDRKNYRVFNIKSTSHQDDFSSIQEAVHRRYKRLLEEKKDFPDLILIDGGKGQLSSALKSLHLLGVRRQPIIALAKREEEIYLPKKQLPLPVSTANPALQFLVRIRDETHRFINGRHVQKRTKSDLKSRLDQVAGLGPVKIKTLLEHFNSLEEIKLTSPESITRLPFFGPKDAERLIQFLQKS